MKDVMITTSHYYFAPMHSYQDESDEQDLLPSKTKIKKQMHDLQDIRWPRSCTALPI